MSAQLIRYVLLAALRDRMMWGIAIIAILGACLSIFSGSAAVIEQGQFVMTYAAGGIRILTLIGLVLFVVFYVRRSFDARDVEFLLTRPLSRLQFILSHAAAFSLLAILSGAFLTLIIFALNRGQLSEGLALWSCGVTAEYILVANTAFFFALVLNSPVSSGLSTLGFYVLARMIGNLMAIAHANLASTGVFKGLAFLMDMIAMVIPRLDLMAQTSWLIYGNHDWHSWAFICAQSLLFLALILTAALIDLKRRQF